MSHSSFKSDFDFSNTVCTDIVLFKDTSFGSEKKSSMSIFDNIICKESLIFTDSNFRNEISICNSKIIKDLDISRCSVNNIITISQTVYQNLRLNYTHIYSPIYIICDDIIESIDFQGAWIDTIVNIRRNNHVKIHDLLFNKSILSKNSIITIEGIEVDKNLEIKFANILGVLSIYNSKLKFLSADCSSVIGSLILKDISIDLISLTNSTATGRIITDSDHCLNPLNRETAYILRHQKENEGDIILSLKYKEIEMRRYNEDFDKLSFLKKIKSLDEITIVKLNFWSNDYGQSWIRGIIFTLMVSFTFTLLLSIINSEVFMLKDLLNLLSNKEFWNKVIEFLWFPSVDELQSRDLWVVIVLLFGKILVAYGIFQTVSSFRKYSKS